MSVLTKIISEANKRRVQQIDFFRLNASSVQMNVAKRLMMHLSQTQYGRQYKISGDDSYEVFRKKIPVTEYDGVRCHIDQMRIGKRNILWDEEVRWFAKSSGTTADVSKYIPTSNASLQNTQYRGSKDVVALYLTNNPSSNIFSGKTLTLGGSHKLDSLNDKIHVGDLSAIMIQNTPKYLLNFRVPSKEVALISNFENKLEAICRQCAKQNVTAFAGVPSWNMLMLKAILKYTGKKDITQVWPNMELFMHGGISFVPYREEYKKIIPSDKMHYIETYNASEGFFAIQDDLSKDDMLLMLDYDVFYEFLDMKDINDHSKAIPLEDVECGVNYALIISTSGGLWRYMIGDTVVFTSKNPYKIKITGRTKHYINAFGEEVIADNAEQALKTACHATSSIVSEYTVAPIFMNIEHQGAHQWVIEFNKKPEDITLFTKILDEALQEVNSDYKAKREEGSTLSLPQVVVAGQGTFYDWMNSRGKLGGQNKIPRLANDRRYVEELLGFVK